MDFTVEILPFKDQPPLGFMKPPDASTALRAVVAAAPGTPTSAGPSRIT